MMKSFATKLLPLLLVCGCDHGSSDEPATGAGSGSAKSKGSAGGFSASLAAELAKGGLEAGSAAPTPVVVSPTTGSATPSPGIAAGSAGIAMSKADAGVAVAAGSGAAKPAIAPAIAPIAPIAGGSGSAAGSATPAEPKVHGFVKVSGELAAIKLSLLPNWVRDYDEGATLSLAVSSPGKDPVTFAFHYGYDDPRAPTERDPYMKWLAEQKILGGSGAGGIVGLNRQRGAAWYLEGVDGAGAPAFRYQVTYGGKRLICYGSLYKESSLGDLRDEVIMQAKKICESITL